MASYPEITAFLKAHTRLAAVETDMKTLESLLHQKECEQVESAVRERMGPALCEKSEQKAKREANSYLGVLLDFQKQIDVKMAFNRTQNCQLALELAGKQEAVSKVVNGRIAEWQRERKQLKHQKEAAAESHDLHFFTKRMEAAEKSMKDRLTQLSQELEISILTEELNRRKVIDEILKLSCH